MSILRIRRGGTYAHIAQAVRCAYHNACVPNHRLPGFGFRPVAEANPNNLRVYRGGFWLHDVDAVRCAQRFRNTTDRRISSVGFRPVAKVKL
jgi:formylglycine-generating enzyme required for sulfatase activity